MKQSVITGYFKAVGKEYKVVEKEAPTTGSVETGSMPMTLERESMGVKPPTVNRLRYHDTSMSFEEERWRHMQNNFHF